MRNQTSDRGTWNGARSRRAPAGNPTTGKTTYQLGKQLESGSTGEVYEATHPFLPGRYVVKVLRPGLAQLPQAVEVFRQELAIIAALRHPHIVQVVEVGELTQDGRPFVVMERLEGQPLERRLGDGRPLPPEQVVAIIKGLAGALQAAHGRGVVHRELNPGNVFLAVAEGHEHGFPKLLNFGIARLRNASGGDAGIGAEEARYMAPEQAQGRAEEIDGRTDQFALAALTYRLLCGADAFRGSDPIAVLYQVVHEPPAAMSSFTTVDPRLEEVVRRGLAKRQAERFDSALEFARSLEEAASSKTLGRTRLGHAETTEGRGHPVVVNAGATTTAPPPSPRGGNIIEMPSELRHDTQPTSPRERPRARTPFAPNALALPGGGVFADEPMWHTEAPYEDDDEVDRVPRQRGRLALFLLGFVLVSVAAALWAGWQPPLSWRQSTLWHTLHLPRAADPTLAEPAQPTPPSSQPITMPAAPATGAASGAAPATGALDPSAAPAPEAAPAATAVPAPAPAAPGTMAPAEVAPATPAAPAAAAPAAQPAVPPSASPAAAAVPAAPAAAPAATRPAESVRPSSASPAAAAVPAAPAAAPAATRPAESVRPSSTSRPRSRDPRPYARPGRTNSHLEGVVWSEAEQRLVPADSTPVPSRSSSTIVPERVVPAPAPEPTPAPQPAQRAPADAPLPMSPAP